MKTRKSENGTGVLASGGLDSSILIGQLLREGRRVHPLYIRCGLCWEQSELRSLRQYMRALSSARLGELVVLEIPVADLYGRHWSLTGKEVPAGHTPDKAVFLPGRNALLMTKAVVWCQLHGVPRLAVASLATSPFADATQRFSDCVQAMVNCYENSAIRITRPFAGLDKCQAMRQGREFPLELTFSCLCPVDGRHCGRCNKCEERRQAFLDADLPDPTEYASPPLCPMAHV
jgi:7-cyano-7-deazaguanine synthase